MKHIRNYENFHIPLWLMKDTCWLLQWKLAGVTMIFPTLVVALVITAMNLRDKMEGFWINLAICFWIIANSFWMCCEFFEYEQMKDYAICPFVAGFLSVGVFYFRRWTGKAAPDLEDYV